MSLILRITLFRGLPQDVPHPFVVFQRAAENEKIQIVLNPEGEVGREIEL